MKTRHTKSIRTHGMDAIPNIQLIRKLAWKYSRVSGIDYDEMFSEALLRYYEALQEFNSEREILLTTYVYSRVSNQLCTFIKKEFHTDRMPETIADDEDSPAQIDPGYTPATPWWMIWETLPLDVKQVLEVLMTDETIDLNKPTKFIRGDLRRALVEMGWSVSQVFETFRTAKLAVCELN